MNPKRVYGSYHLHGNYSSIGNMAPRYIGAHSCTYHEEQQFGELGRPKVCTDALSSSPSRHSDAHMVLHLLVAWLKGWRGLGFRV